MKSARPTFVDGNKKKTQPAPAMREIKVVVHRRLLERMDLEEARRMPVEDLFQECLQRVNLLLNEMCCPLSAPEKERLVREIMDGIFGLGPIEVFLHDPTISDILVNNLDKVYIERWGQLERTDVSFASEAELLQVIQRIAARVGRRIDESSPMLDARLPDGSRVNAIIPPLSIDGPALSIRRFGTVPIDEEKLLELHTFTPEMIRFLKAAVRSKMNILISGGTGSGKTTLLNVISRWIPDEERLITIEDAAELQLPREHVVRLETRPSNIEGRGEVTQRDLLRNSLRMRPDRIIIGEVRGAEALDMLQAMNTGHEGSMTTVHANNPRDAMRRVETMVSMAGFQFPVNVVRQQMSSALNLLLHLSRMAGGRRKVVSISEITGMECDAILIQDLFRFQQTGVDAEGHATGYFETCGIRPRIIERLEAHGNPLPDDLFERKVLGAA